MVLRMCVRGSPLAPIRTRIALYAFKSRGFGGEVGLGERSIHKMSQILCYKTDSGGPKVLMTDRSSKKGKQDYDSQPG